jgi:hypothetical protein
MSEVKKYDHSIFNHPGDEGSLSQEQGKTYSSADDPVAAAPSGGPHEHTHKPGVEGSSGLTPKMLDSGYIMGCQEVPSAPLSDWLQGPDVRATYVPPASNANSYEDMPGAD